LVVEVEHQVLTQPVVVELVVLDTLPGLILSQEQL
jgi:hypothetical protein